MEMSLITVICLLIAIIYKSFLCGFVTADIINGRELFVNVIAILLLLEIIVLLRFMAWILIILGEAFSTIEDKIRDFLTWCAGL